MNTRGRPKGIPTIPVRVKVPIVPLVRALNRYVEGRSEPGDIALLSPVVRLEELENARIR